MSEIIRVEVYPGSNDEVEEFEYEVYLSEGYITPHPERKVQENNNYPAHNIVAVYSNDVLVGSVRLVIDPSPRNGLFSLHCFEHFEVWPWAKEILYKVPPNRLMQVGTMVIRKQYRGGLVFEAMFKKILEIAIHEKIIFAVTTVDESFCNRLNRRKIPFIPMGETLYYMETRTVPAFVARDWVTGGAIPENILAVLGVIGNKNDVSVHTA